MANIDSKTLREIADAGDEASLDRLDQFTRTGDQDESNDTARAGIAARRAQLKQNAITQGLTKQAQDYRAGMPAMQEKAYGQVEGQTRRNLAEQMVGINRDYNSRGMLYSGARQGAQSDARGTAASGLIGARQSINAGYEGNARRMEAAAAGGAQAGQAAQMANEDAIYGQALANVQERQKMFSAVGQAAGAGIGTYAGMKR